MQHLWFTRKRYGWGWVPATWQGWLVTILYAGALVALGLTIDESSPPQEVAFMFFLPAAILTTMFFHIAIRKGEKPRWQWGEKK